MPRYEYRCRACGQTFEKTRPMAEASAPIDCPSGHGDTVKLFSMVAVSTGAAATGASRSAGPAGGGCCGGGCCS
jgi:putative FmdB family regulatory protein